MGRISRDFLPVIIKSSPLPAPQVKLNEDLTKPGFQGKFGKPEKSCV